MLKPPAPLLCIVDGNAILHRAYHALPPMTAPDGRVVHAAYGFLSIFFKALADLRPTHVAVTFDLPGGTFRNELFPEYQSQREEKPDDLYAQIPMIKDVLGGMRIPVVEAEGFEADDAIGTMVEKVRGKREEGRGVGSRTIPKVIILTGDKDLLQLVGDGVEVVLLRRGMTDTVRYDRDAVIERFGFPPERIPDFKALAGDPSDNYPGVPGVGEKTATELVKAFGGVEEILKRAEGRGQRDEWMKPFTAKLAEKLRLNADTARLGLKLATIVRDVPITFDLAACARGSYDREPVIAKLREFGFQSLAARLPTTELQANPSHSTGLGSSKPHAIAPTSTQPELIGLERAPIDILSDSPAIRRALTDARTAGVVALAAIADEDDLLHGHPRALGLAFRDRAIGIHPWGVALSESAALLRDASVTKDVHDAKSLLHALHRSRIELEGFRYDTEILSYLAAPGNRSHDLAHVAFAELGIEAGGDEARIKNKESREQTDEVSTAERAGREAGMVASLVPILCKKVEDAGLMRVYEEFDRPLVPVLFRMEVIGVALDVKVFQRLGASMRKDLERADRAISKLAGEEFNVDSPQQLKRILFEKLGLAVTGIKKTAKGKTLSTAAAELEKLKGAHPIIEHLLTHRELQKLLSTYVDALPALVDPTDGRVHTTYHQTVAATGRLSSSQPNLQNIPASEPWGPTIRSAFIAEDGYRLLAFDYSQFELRIAATLSGDRVLQRAFQQGQDIHAATGAEVFGVAPKDVTKDQRRVAKAINFGILYGMGASALAITAGISRAEAEEYIAKYFQAYAELHEWIETTKALARKRGYVETLFGRKRFLPEITSGVPQVRAAAERMAVNMPIQGTQADLLKRAMIRADEWIRSNDFSPSSRGGARGGGGGERPVPAHASGEGEGRTRQMSNVRGQASNNVRMVLTVHDELVFEVREEFVAEAAAALRDMLVGVEKLAVPIVVEAKMGKNWGDLATAR